jgi:hypothetical protein
MAKMSTSKTIPENMPSIETIMDAIEQDDHIGFCTACGEEQGGCEPDACNYECESCGAKSVFGAEELLMRMA